MPSQEIVQHTEIPCSRTEHIMPANAGIIRRIPTSIVIELLGTKMGKCNEICQILS